MAPSTSARRAAIREAALACFAERGYDRTSTAAICARAGVSSGTFFHHFPTKAALLVSILDTGVEQAQRRLAGIVERAEQDADAGLGQWLDHLVDEVGEPHLAGLVSALDAVPDEPRVAELLARDAEQIQHALTAIVAAGQRQGRWDAARPADQVATWLGVLADGIVVRSTAAPGFDLAARRAELTELVHRILR